MHTAFKPLLFLTIVTSGLSFFACNKDDDNNSTVDALTSGSWKLTSDYLTPAVDYNDDGVTENELFPFYPACQKDNIIMFQSNGLAINDEGATKCIPTAPQKDTSYWQFINNNSKIITRESTTSTDYDTVDVVELSSSILKVRSTYVDGGIMYTDVFTFTH